MIVAIMVRHSRQSNDESAMEYRSCHLNVVAIVGCVKRSQAK